MDEYSADELNKELDSVLAAIATEESSFLDISVHDAHSKQAIQGL